MTPLKCWHLRGWPLRWSVSALVVLAFSHSASGEVHSYTDENGAVHFVDDPTKIPERFRKKAAPISAPPISRVPGRSYVDTTPTTPSSQSNRTGKSTVEIYVTDWCPYCQKLEAFLKAKKIRYTRNNIERSAAAKQAYNSLGGGGIPITKVGSEVIHGFDTGELSRVLKLN